MHRTIGIVSKRPNVFQPIRGPISVSLDRVIIAKGRDADYELRVWCDYVIACGTTVVKVVAGGQFEGPGEVGPEPGTLRGGGATHSRFL